jgi:hypothetical protein
MPKQSCLVKQSLADLGKHLIYCRTNTYIFSSCYSSAPLHLHMLLYVHYNTYSLHVQIDPKVRSSAPTWITCGLIKHMPAMANK